MNRARVSVLPPATSEARRSRFRGSTSLLIALLAIAGVAMPAFSQATSITGTVVSAASGNPIPAAQVLIVGTTIGSTTDGNGRFRLSGLSGETVSLEVGRIGYRALRTTAAVGVTNLRLALTEQSVALDEVVITAHPAGSRSGS